MFRVSLICSPWNLFESNTVQWLQFKIQSSVSHDPSESIVIRWIGAQETFVNVENSYAAKKNSYDSLLIFFVKLQMSLLSLPTILICPCWIKVLIYLKKTHTRWGLNTYTVLFCMAILRSHTQSLCKTYYFTYWGGCSFLDIYVVLYVVSSLRKSQSSNKITLC